MKSCVIAFGGFDGTQFDRTLSMEFAWMVWLGSFQLNNKKWPWMLVPSAVHIRDRSKMAQRWGKWIWDQDGFRGLDRWHLHVTHLSETDETEYHLCWGLSSHRFPVVRDGHHPTSTGVYTTTMRTPYLRWDDHPQYKELIEPGTYQYDHTESHMK